MFRNRNQKLNWKTLIIPATVVLVLLGAIFAPAPRAKSAVTEYTALQMGWQVGNDYTFGLGQSINSRTVTATGITFSGRTSAGFENLRAGSDVKITLPMGNLTRSYEGKIMAFYVAAVPLESYNDSSCYYKDPNGSDHSCSSGAPGGLQVQMGSPVGNYNNVPVIFKNAPANPGPQTYVLVPAVWMDVSKVDGEEPGADLKVYYFGHNRQKPTSADNFFTVNWIAGNGGAAPVAHASRGVSTTPVVIEKSGDNWATRIQNVIDNAPEAIAGTLATVINIVLTIILTIVQGALWAINALIILPIIKAMLGGNPAFIAAQVPEFVQFGWVYVRDVMNLMFILVLIFAGVATMLRIGEYGLKKTITRVIIVALAVNFSMLAGQIILNFAQIMMNTFINPTAVDEIARGVGFDHVAWSDFSFSAGAVKGTIMLAFSIVYDIGVSVCLLALAAFLVIRLVGVWILLMVAPAAYILYLFEPTQEYLGQWWHKFLSYAFFAPVIAFFLAIINKLVASPDFGQPLEGTGDTLGGAITGGMHGVLVLAFLAASLKVAEMLGIYGADTVIGGAQKMWKTGFGVGGWSAKIGGGFALRKYNEWYGHKYDELKKAGTGKFGLAAFSALQPVAAYKGWMALTHEKEHEASEMAEAVGREGMTGLRQGYTMPYAQFVSRKHQNDKMKEMLSLSKEQQMGLAVELDGKTDHYSQDMRIALMGAAASGGYLDDVLRMSHFAEKYKQPDGTIYNAKILGQFLKDYLSTDGSGEHMSEQAYRFIDEDLEEYGKKTKHYEYLGHVEYDPTTKQYTMANEQQQASYAAGEFNKLGGRDRIGAAPHNFTSIRAEVNEKGETIVNEAGDVINAKGQLVDKTGKVLQEKANVELKEKVGFGQAGGELGEFENKMFRSMNFDATREAQHAQGRMLNWLLSSSKDEAGNDIIVDKQGRLALPEDPKEREIAKAKVKTLFEANPDFVRALYAKAQDMDPRKAIESKDAKVWTIRFNDGTTLSDGSEAESGTGPAAGTARPSNSPDTFNDIDLGSDTD